MRTLLLGLIGYLFLTSVCFASDDDYYYDESDYEYQKEDDIGANAGAIDGLDETSVPLFESPCAYAIAEIVRKTDCNEINLNYQSQVEVLLPVSLNETGQEVTQSNNSILVPFLISQKQKITTFSPEAMKKLKLTPGANVSIVYETLKAVEGDENILGLDIVKRTLIALDLYKYDAAIAILSDKGDGYLINWPLDSFRDKKLVNKAKRVEEGYKKLMQKIKETKIKYNETVSSYRNVVVKKDKEIESLKTEVNGLIKTMKSLTGKAPLTSNKTTSKNPPVGPKKN